MTELVAALIQKLLALSKEDRVNWEETADEDTFLATESRFVVTIERRVGDWDSRYYCVRISDKNDKMLEDSTVYSGDPQYAEARELYELARRRALRVDAQLSELLSSLDQKLH